MYTNNFWSDLFRDFAGTLNQLLLGESVIRTALQSSSFGNQAGTAETELAHLLLNVGTNLYIDTVRWSQTNNMWSMGKV